MKQSASKLPIQVSHPGKLFWPEEGYTKLDLIEFYAEIFPKLQPYVDDRILTMERCPDGMRGQVGTAPVERKISPAATESGNSAIAILNFQEPFQSFDHALVQASFLGPFQFADRHQSAGGIIGIMPTCRIPPPGANPSVGMFASMRR